MPGLGAGPSRSGRMGTMLAISPIFGFTRGTPVADFLSDIFRR